MYKILQKREVDNLPVPELNSTLHAFLEPVSMHLPEKRLRDVGTLAVQGVISGKPEDAAELGRVLADDLLARGAREILADVYGEAPG